MHTTTLLLAVLGASGVLASDGAFYPHKRATLKSRGSVNKGAVQKRASSENPSYLTSKTERESEPQRESGPL